MYRWNIYNKNQFYFRNGVFRCTDGMFTTKTGFILEMKYSMKVYNVHTERMFTPKTGFIL